MKNTIAKALYYIQRNGIFRLAINGWYYLLVVHYKKNLSYKYLKWKWVEIWALMNPFPHDKKQATVRYSDYKSTKDLIEAYPALSGFDLVDVEYVCPADDLHSIPTDSQDFLIASHVFEHLPNPIGWLMEFYRVCKNEGIIYLTVPEKTRTGDKFRTRTPLSHMIDDYKSPSSERDLEHFREHIHMSPIDTDAFEKEAKILQKTSESFHYHVFLEEDVIDIINWCNRNIAVHFEIIDHKPLLLNNPADLDFALIIRCHK